MTDHAGTSKIGFLGGDQNHGASTGEKIQRATSVDVRFETLDTELKRCRVGLKCSGSTLHEGLHGLSINGDMQKRKRGPLGH